MYKLVIICALFFLFSCDKVENPYPPSTELDQTIYPGTWSDYQNNEWPEFSQNTNTNRNVLIEDFTGHKCIYCPAAATLAENLAESNEGRVFVAGIHSGPTGIGVFQELQAPLYTHNFTNPQGLEIGNFFGSIAGSPFVGNPWGAISRYPKNGFNTHDPSEWTSIVNEVLNGNSLKVNLQAKVNYYSQTNGFYLHTEVEKLMDLPNEIAQVVYLIEDTITKPQAFPAGKDSLTYVHHHVQRACIDGRAFGRTISETDKNENGKYYLNYSYKIPNQYAVSNLHLLIFIIDKTTHEIYQVIKSKIE
jgi:hypothetical protein